MKKHITRILAVCSIVMIALFLLYQSFKPKPAPILQEVFAVKSDVILDSTNIEQYVVDNPGTHYLWFCAVDQNDCKYVIDNIMKQVLEDAKLTAIENLKYVDFTKSDISGKRLKNIWGFQNYPAFVTVTSENGVITPISILEWDAENPFDANTLKQWLTDNGLYNGIIPIAKSK